jgi:hypothetical protein
VRICEPKAWRRQNTEKLHKKLRICFHHPLTDEIADEAGEHAISLEVTAQLPS